MNLKQRIATMSTQTQYMKDMKDSTKHIMGFLTPIFKDAVCRGLCDENEAREYTFNILEEYFMLEKLPNSNCVLFCVQKAHSFLHPQPIVEKEAQK